MARIKLGVLVSGNGSNLQAIIDACASDEIAADVALVVSNKPGVKALSRAEAAGIPAECIPHREFSTREAFDEALVKRLKQANVDWVVLAGFMRLVTPLFVEAYNNRIINIHPSLLPAFPGLNAAKQALDYGVKLTGCTVHLVTEAMDSGAVIAQTPVPVLDDDTEQTLMPRMHAAEHRTLVQVLRSIAAGGLQIEGDDARPKIRIS